MPSNFLFCSCLISLMLNLRNLALSSQVLFILRVDTPLIQQLLNICICTKILIAVPWRGRCVSPEAKKNISCSTRALTGPKLGIIASWFSGNNFIVYFSPMPAFICILQNCIGLAACKRRTRTPHSHRNTKINSTRTWWQTSAPLGIWSHL